MFKSKSLITAFLAIIALLFVGVQPATATATAATVSWVNTLQGPGDGEIYSTTADASGNVYVSGYFAGTYSNHSPSVTANSVGDLYVAKFNSAGTETWMKNFGATVGGGVKDVAVDSAGNVYGTGWYCGTVTIGSLGAFAATGNCDGFVFKLNSSGTPVWFKHWGQLSNWDGSEGLALDAAGNIYVAAYVGDVNLQGAVGIDGITWNAPFAGSSDGHVVVKLNPSGVAQYATALPSNFYIDGFGHPFAASADGKVLVGGSFSGSVNFGAAGTFTSAGDYDSAWLEFATSGAVNFVKVYGGALGQTIRGIAYDAANNIYVQGIYESTITVAGTNLTSIGSDDTFVAKFDPTANNLAWIANWGGTSNDDTDGIAVDPAGNVVAIGSHRGAVTIGSLGTFTTSPIGNNDGIAVGINNDGTFGWVKTITGSSDNEFAWARPSIVSGAAIVAGRFASNANFGDGFTATFNGAGNNVDGFFEKVSLTWSNTTPVTPFSAGSSALPALPAIQVGSISPRVLDSAVGGVVTVTAFNASKVTSVKLGNVSLPLKILSTDKFQVTLPAHAVGYADLTFTTTEGTVPLSNAVRYSDVLNTHFGAIKLVNPTSAALAKAKAKFAKITYTDRVVTKGKKPTVTITLTGRIKN